MQPARRPEKHARTARCERDFLDSARQMQHTIADATFIEYELLRQIILIDEYEVLGAW
jgi:hypothetical protein